MSKNSNFDYPVFEIEFYLILGVHYHKIKKDKIGASINLSKNPIFSMNYDLCETFFGLFSPLNTIDNKKQQKSHGLNYFVNKYLYINNKFKNFISQLFIYCGEDKKFLQLHNKVSK